MVGNWQSSNHVVKRMQSNSKVILFSTTVPTSFASLLNLTPEAQEVGAISCHRWNTVVAV